jgi:4'-phosphopantetheinyl transferase EntD
MARWQAVEPDVVFDLELVHGRCVGIRIPDLPDAVEALAESMLPALERNAHSTRFAVRRRAWVGGRVALRRTLTLLDIEAPAILSDDRGAPMLPSGVAASISHKDWIAVALVARETEARVGVDVETDVEPSSAIASRVLAGDELCEVQALDSTVRLREVLVRFSAKEAVYKALDPFVRRYVGFKEVSISLLPTGDAVVRSQLRAKEGPFAIGVTWRRHDGLVLTTARVAPALRGVDASG